MFSFPAIVYFYFAYTIGVIFLGEAFVLPGIYLGYTGRLDLELVLIFTLCGALLADTFWYTLGLLIPKERLAHYRYVRSRLDRAKPFDEFFRQHKLRVLFYSKFLFGTRMVFQLLAGIYRVPLWQYALVVLLSNIVWILLLTVIGLVLGAGLATLEDTAFGLQIALTALLAVTLGIYFVGRPAVKWLFKHREQDE
ncbi:MAG: VTT domain-containing protein [Candidatus Paceibacterota bacterium]